MDDLITEVRLGRAFACEFEEFWKSNPELIPPELLKKYMLLKQHYEVCMSRELS